MEHYDWSAIKTGADGHLMVYLKQNFSIINICNWPTSQQRSQCTKRPLNLNI